MSEYTVATKNVQFEKGTLLQTAHLMIVDQPLPQPSLEEALEDISEPSSDESPESDPS
jgi:hypothetical protein